MSSSPSCFFLFLFLLPITVFALSQEALQELLDENRQRFAPVDSIRVLGPSSFPKPTGLISMDAVPCIEPTLGKHRRQQNAVIAYAAEYLINNYVSFIESLQHIAKYTGDIVLFISPLDKANERVWRYLQSVPNLIVYVPAVECFNYEREVVASAKGGIRTCVCHNLYCKKDSTTGKLKPLQDPRSDRVLATIRYELYWSIVSREYDPTSWIHVVDARDTFFQENPFGRVPNSGNGTLLFFGENQQAVRIGQSKMNRKWLTLAYGPVVAKTLHNKPIICSGATLGQQAAMEQYTRAIIAEADSTQTVLMGVDQGFHNYLWYSGKLQNCNAIQEIVVFDQGTGIVSNLGAMRTKPLREWGNGNIVNRSGKYNETLKIVNWDGSLVPVVHQFDRHAELSQYFFKTKTYQLLRDWRERTFGTSTNSSR